MAYFSHSQINENGFYIFSSRPRPVESRSKFREPPPQRNHGNIVYDRSVVRGNTYAQGLTPNMSHPDPAMVQRQQEIRRRAIARKRASERFRSTTPEALRGRQHIDVQTDTYLEEVSDVIMTSDIGCQVDAFLEKPATALFVPAKSGKDAETQIEEGELFDFDREVQPLLEVLVGKVIERSLEEVREEEELARLKARQRAFIELRNNELAEEHRLQERERRRREEKERRVAEQREGLMMQKETAEKIAARVYTKHYLADLLPSTFAMLRRDGYFDDPVEKDLKTNFFPWLKAEVNRNLDKREAARAMVDAIIYDMAQKRPERFSEK